MALTEAKTPKEGAPPVGQQVLDGEWVSGTALCPWTSCRDSWEHCDPNIWDTGRTSGF